MISISILIFTLLSLVFFFIRQHNGRDTLFASQPRPLDLYHLYQTRPRQNPQRSGRDGAHARYRIVSRWDSVHAGECPSGDAMGRGGWTRVRDCGEFCSGIPCPRGDGAGYKVAHLQCEHPMGRSRDRPAGSDPGGVAAQASGGGSGASRRPAKQRWRG
jgi:hypothetical protein